MSDPYSVYSEPPDARITVYSVPKPEPVVDPYADLTPQVAPEAATAVAPAPVDPYADIAPAAPASKPWAATRGFVSGLLEQNPQMGAEALEGFSHLAPDAFSGVLGSGSQALKEFAGRSPEAYKLTAPRMRDIKGLDDALGWAGETFGSGVASSVPPMIGGLVGAGAGALTPIPGGTAAGAITGALIPSYMLNYGEVYKALKDEKMDPKLAAKWAGGATIPIAGLDVASLGSLVGRFGGVQEAKKEVIRNVAKRIALQAAGGAKVEGATEMAQGAIKDLTVLATTEKKFDPYDFAMSRLEDFAGGAIVGGPMAAPAGIRTPRYVVPPDADTLARPPQDWPTLFDNLEKELGPGASQRPPPPPPPGGALDQTTALEKLLGFPPKPDVAMAQGDRPLPPLGPIPPVVDRPRPDIDVYHGSPYEFGEFDANYIGTGEGAQSYGHGFYFAENPAVATSYKKAGFNPQQDPTNIAYDALAKHEGDHIAAIEDLKTDYQDASIRPKYIAEALSILEKKLPLDAMELPQGNVYKVRIRARRDQFLDWDKPLAEQSPQVQQALQSISTDPRILGKDLYNRLADRAWHDAHAAGTLGTASAGDTRVNPAAASQRLAALGIPGIKYLDQLSRPATTGIGKPDAAYAQRMLDSINERVAKAGGVESAELAKNREYWQQQLEYYTKNPEGTSNFVVFDPSTLSISQRNGQEFVRSQISTLTPKAMVASEAIQRAVKAAIRQVAGADVAGRTELLDENIPMQPGAAVEWNIPPGQEHRYSLAGAYYPQRETQRLHLPLVQVSLSKGLDSMQTSMHEGWHAIEGTLLKEEIAILRAATAQLRALLMRVIPNKAMGYQTAHETEIWADAASVFAYERLLREVNPALMAHSTYNFEREASKLHPAVRAIFDKIARLIERVRNAMNSLGFQNVEDIFESFYQGEMASRRNGLPSTMLERWWANEAGYSQALIDNSEAIATQTARNDSLARREEGEQIESNEAQLDMLGVKAGIERVYTATGGGNTTPVPIPTRMAALHADRLSRYEKWWMFLDRLVDRFPDFAPLVNYSALAMARMRDIAKIHDVGIMISKRWRSLGSAAEGLAALIDDVANMNYRTPQEVARKIVRHPTSLEMAMLATKHKVTAAALQVYELQKKFFADMLNTTANLAIEDAKRLISDPNALADRIVAIRNQVAAQMKRPYFPFMRFGRWHVVVKDSKGNTVDRVAFERRGLKSGERRQQEYLKKINSVLPTGYTAYAVTMSENSVPYAGMPPALLESIAQNLNLTKQQRDELEQLRFEMAPSNSFRHQFQHKNYTPGYSHDFLRSFSRYAFHGARYIGNVKYAWQMREQAAAAGNYQGNLASELRHFMDDHLANTILSTKSDYGRIRGAMFVWALGYVPAAAAVNLSQNMLTHSFLASRFGGLVRGDYQAAKAMAKAMANVKNFYRKGAYETMSGFEYKAIDYGIKSGRISETQGAELAGIAQGEPLLGMGTRRGVRAVQVFIEKAAFLFEMAEQLNRRAAFRATLDLAMKFPNSKGVKEAMQLHNKEYLDLTMNRGFTHLEAQATVSAIHVVNQTQFIYSKETRPRIMRGKASIFFVFQSYMLHLLQLLGANKSSVLPRFILYMWLIAGLQGLPGADEGEAIFNKVASWWFGKDFKLRHQLRAWLKDLFGSEDYADLTLHGLSSRGFGIPALTDLMGEKPGRGLSLKPGQNVPFPNIDMSRSLGSGHILPIQLDKIMDPGKDANKAIAEQTQRASGAIMSIPFNWYKAIFDIHTPATDPKRWENSAPRVTANLSKAYRAYTEGFERGRGGPNSAAQLLPFDRRDPEQMAEIIAMAMGFQSARKTTFWEREIAKMDVEQHIKVSKEMLMIQYFEALKGNDPKELEGMNKKIVEFNDNLPDYAKGEFLSVKSIRESMMTRERGKVMKEAGFPNSKKAWGISEYFNKLFPDVVDARKVKP